MPTTTRQLAKIAKVSEQTVRNYTDRYSELLSSTARGETGPRLFSDEDVQIFCSIADLRRENVPPDEVIERLQRGDVYIEITDHTTPHHATPNETQDTQSHTTLPDASQMLMLVRSDLQRQINELRRAHEATQRNQELIRRNDKLQGALWGFIVGLGIAALYWLTLYFVDVVTSGFVW